MTYASKYTGAEIDAGIENAKQALEQLENLSASITGITWKFYEDMNTADNLELNFNFTANGQEFTGLYGFAQKTNSSGMIIPEALRDYSLQFRLASTGEYITVFGLKEWTSTKYQTIFTENTNVSLEGLAVKQDTSIAEQLSTKSNSLVGAINEAINNANNGLDSLSTKICGRNMWVLRDNLNKAAEVTLDFKFISGDIEFDGLRGTTYYEESITPDDGTMIKSVLPGFIRYELAYRKAYTDDYLVVYTDSSWIHTKYRTIITEDTDISLEKLGTKQNTPIATLLQTDSKSLVGAINEVNSKVQVIQAYNKPGTDEWYEDDQFTQQINIEINPSLFYVDVLSKKMQIGHLGIDLVDVIWQFIKNTDIGEAISNFIGDAESFLAALVDNVSSKAKFDNLETSAKHIPDAINEVRDMVQEIQTPRKLTITGVDVNGVTHTYNVYGEED